MLNKITEDNFKNIDSHILLDPKWYSDMEEMVISIGAADTPDYAQKYAILLAKNLDEIADKVDAQLFAKYLKLIGALRLFSLATVSDMGKEKFFSEQSLNVFNSDFVDVQYWIDSLFRQYYSAPEIIEDIRKSIVKGLENNFQVLGSSKNLRLTIQGQSVQPTIKNWLIDYRSFAQTAKQTTKNVVRERFDEINYINQSPNTKLLTSVEREILLKILKTYDWLAFAHIEYNFSLPGQTEVDAPLEGERHEVLSKEQAEVINKLLDQPLKETPTNVPSSIQPKSPIQLRPVSPPRTLSKPVTAFDQKLVQASAPQHGQSLEGLKKKLEENKISAIPSTPSAPAVKMTPQEIKREVATPELPGYNKPILPAAPKPVVPLAAPINLGAAKAPSVPVKPIAPPRPTPAVGNFTVIDDLKKLDLKYLRLAPLPVQISNLKTSIFHLAQANNVLPFFVMIAFEQSPLFKAYLSHGSATLGGGQSNADLTQPEFEAIADLRKELEKM